MTQPQSQQQGDGNGFVYLLVGLGVALVGLPAVILGMIAGRVSRGRPGVVIALTLIGLLGAGLMWMQWAGLLATFEALRASGQQLRRGEFGPSIAAVLGLWVRTLPAAPLIGVLWESMRPKTEAEREQETYRLAEQRSVRQSTQAAKRATTAPDSVSGANGQPIMVLGAAGEGSGSQQLQHKGWATLTAEQLNRHIVILGENGTGKSELVLRLVYGAAVVYGWHICIIDAKGSSAFADQVQAALHRNGIAMRVCPRVAYDGWRGTHEEIYNKLIGSLEFSEPFYKQTVEAATRLAVYAGEPPRSSTEFLARFDATYLERYYQADDAGAQRLANLERRHLQSAYMRYDAFFAQVQGMFDGQWSFENIQAAYFVLDGVAMREQARTAARWLLADFAQFVATRLPAGQRALLVVDEYPAVAGAADAARLFEQVRSPRGNGGAGVVVTSQSYAALGDPRDAERMISAAGTTISLRQYDAEPIAARAGMRQIKRKTISTTPQRGFTPAAPYSVAQREEEDYTLSPDTIRRLATGECVVIPTGAYQRVAISRVHVSEEELAIQAQRRVEVRQRPLIEVTTRRAPPPPPSTPATGQSAATGQPDAEPHEPQF